MSWNEYHFLSSWPVGAEADAVYAVLYEVAGYPGWWPEVREARQLDDDRITLRTRAFLPYDITFTLTREVADPLAHVLQARLHGDIEGTIRWTIEETPGAGSIITWDQRVVARKPLLRRTAPLARPVFRANHALMMRHGHAGLQVFLAGHRFATRAHAERHTPSGGGARQG